MGRHGRGEGHHSRRSSGHPAGHSSINGIGSVSRRNSGLVSRPRSPSGRSKTSTSSVFILSYHVCMSDDDHYKWYVLSSGSESSTESS
jgi:hypothetical protein